MKKLISVDYDIILFRPKNIQMKQFFRSVQEANLLLLSFFKNQK